MGAEHSLLYSCYFQLMNTCSSLNYYSFAINYANKAISCLRRVYPRSHSEFATLHNHLAALFMFSDNYPNAREALRETLQILQICYGRCHPDYIEKKKLYSSLLK